MYGKQKTFTGSTASTSDGATVKEVRAGTIHGMRRFVLEVLTGAVRVMPSIASGGEAFSAIPLVLSREPAVDGSNVVTETEGTFIAVAVPQRLHYFFGEYTGLRFLQVGTTPSSFRLMATEA
jgi:hypothetical protein